MNALPLQFSYGKIKILKDKLRNKKQKHPAIQSHSASISDQTCQPAARVLDDPRWNEVLEEKSEPHLKYGQTKEQHHSESLYWFCQSSQILVALPSS